MFVSLSPLAQAHALRDVTQTPSAPQKACASADKTQDRQHRSAASKSGLRWTSANAPRRGLAPAGRTASVRTAHALKATKAAAPPAARRAPAAATAPVRTRTRANAANNGA
ncbi:hypothetical protein SRHO_G00165420 [Serrasalmus rhombeus]